MFRVMFATHCREFCVAALADRAAAEALVWRWSFSPEFRDQPVRFWIA